MALQSDTEQRIICSAEKLFSQKGKTGVSMQEIADDAGINRTLLNYYFRTKDQLFEAVFRKTLSCFVPGLAVLLKSDMPFDLYIDRLIETVIDTMLEYPQIPIFVLQELSSNPNRMPQIIREMGMDPELAAQKLARDGKVPSGDYHQFFLNVLSLCIFPFAARPVVTEILYKGDSGSFSEAMKRRKKELPQLVRNMLSQKTAP